LPKIEGFAGDGRSSVPPVAAQASSLAVLCWSATSRRSGAARDQLGVRAALRDPALFHDQDLVRVDDGREAVRDDQRGAVPRRALQLAGRPLVGESSAEVASSKIMIGGFLSRGAAIATRCFSPPESLRPRSPTIVS
jgi:hypothetical protein